MVHGRNSYKRSAALGQFVMHRGMIISTMQVLPGKQKDSFLGLFGVSFIQVQVIQYLISLSNLLFEYGIFELFRFLKMFCRVTTQDCIVSGLQSILTLLQTFPPFQDLLAHLANDAGNDSQVITQIISMLRVHKGYMFKRLLQLVQNWREPNQDQLLTEIKPCILELMCNKIQCGDINTFLFV